MPAAEPDEAPVRHRLAGVRVFVQAGQPEALAPVQVYLPQLGDPDAARVHRAPPHQHPRAARIPDRVGQAGLLLVGELHQPGPIAVHQPDVLVAVPIAAEGDAPAVGREAGIAVPGSPLGQAGRRPAPRRHRPDVPQQLEDHRVAVLRDPHPGALGQGEADAVRGPVRLVDGPAHCRRRRLCCRRRRLFCRRRRLCCRRRRLCCRRRRLCCRRRRLFSRRRSCRERGSETEPQGEE